MQQFLVFALILFAIGYFIWHVYQLFFAQQTNCKGCGLTPKHSNESDI